MPNPHPQDITTKTTSKDYKHTHTHTHTFTAQISSHNIQTATFEASSRATHHVEVQSVDADAGVVLDAQINVLLDTEAEVSSI